MTPFLDNLRRDFWRIPLSPTKGSCGCVRSPLAHLNGVKILILVRFPTQGDEVGPPGGEMGSLAKPPGVPEKRQLSSCAMAGQTVDDAVRVRQ